jgi:hypothetical protein
MPGTEGSLYTRLCGYDAIAAVVDDLQERLESDSVLGRYWSARRSLETDRRVRQLTIDYLNRTTRHWDIPAPAVNSPPPGHELAGLHDDAG